MHKVWLNTYDPSLKFSGKEREATSGDDYFGARYFSGDNYRFLSVDPVRNRTEALANPKLWNLYPYCRNNPITFLDPDGRDFKYFKPSAELKRQIVAAGLYFDYGAFQMESILNAASFFLPMSPGMGVRGVKPSSAGRLKNWVKRLFSRSRMVSADKFRRIPKNLYEQMALKAAKGGAGSPIERLSKLGDPRFKGWEKMQYVLKSKDGTVKAVVHYVRNPKTGVLKDFKFK